MKHLFLIATIFTSLTLQAADFKHIETIRTSKLTSFDIWMHPTASPETLTLVQTELAKTVLFLEKFMGYNYPFESTHVYVAGEEKNRNLFGKHILVFDEEMWISYFAPNEFFARIMAKSWFGDHITSNQWILDGLTTYLALEYIEATEGVYSATEAVNKYWTSENNFEIIKGNQKANWYTTNLKSALAFRALASIVGKQEMGEFLKEILAGKKQVLENDFLNELYQYLVKKQKPWAANIFNNFITSNTVSTFNYKLRVENNTLYADIDVPQEYLNIPVEIGVDDLWMVKVLAKNTFGELQKGIPWPHANKAEDVHLDLNRYLLVKFNKVK